MMPRFPDVEPVMGRPLCYRVRSRQQPAHQHFVDWIEGYCTCPDFHKTAKAKSEWSGHPYRCYHMERAMLCGWDNYVETAREMQLASDHTPHAID